jgi:hypothetical protein
MVSLKINFSGSLIPLIHSFIKKSGISSNHAEVSPFNLGMTVAVPSSEIRKGYKEFQLQSTTICNDL